MFFLMLILLILSKNNLRNLWFLKKLRNRQ